MGMSIKYVSMIVPALFAVSQAAAQNVEAKVGEPSVVATTSARTTIRAGVRLSWSFDEHPRIVVSNLQARADITRHSITRKVTASGDTPGISTTERVYYVDFS